MQTSTMREKFLKNKTVLITGGTGSFGKNFAKYLLSHTSVGKVIIFSRDELKQFEFRKEVSDDRLRFFIGDIRDQSRLERAFKGVDIIVHAAALKQVPILEYNPFEAVKTNVMGCQNVIDAAINQNVKKVLLISTDKAVEPINLYGATKLCAERLFIDGNVYSKESIFSCVRYGNVIGSRGSLIETLLKAKSGQTLEVTHEAMTRFWINLEQSFGLVLFALQEMQGGEIFVPKIPSMKVISLFELLAPKIKRSVTGMRPGEKMHETLLTTHEAKHSRELSKYFVVLPENQESFDVKKRFSKWFKTGTELPEGFSYSSNTNPVWLTSKELLRAVHEKSTRYL